MQEVKQTVDQAAQEVKRQRPLLRRLGALLVIIAVFFVGVLAGEGLIRFNSYQPSSTDLPARLDYSSVNEVYESLKQNYDGKLTEEQLLNGLKAGLANATEDPYTEYFTATEAKTFNKQINNSFSGVGAELGKDKDSNLIVVAPIRGMPAEKAGLKSKDVIIAIDGKSASGLSVEEAVQKIRGKAGTKVKLTVVRNKSERQDITITRQNIQVPSVDYKLEENGIAHLRINTFGDDTAALIKSAAKDLKAKGVKGVVLDLRDNPGGLLDAAVVVSSQWLPSGTNVLQEKRGSTVVDTFRSEGDSPLKGVPTVVLINAGSASASEIVAGALHDNKAATLIGEKSFGKGVVQQLLPLKDGSELKVTVASWYRPNGQNINKKGINPDKTVKPAETDTPGGTDAQKEAAIQAVLGLIR